jgi:hypothetical protein
MTLQYFTTHCVQSLQQEEEGEAMGDVDLFVMQCDVLRHEIYFEM